jgi:hypothetical protein
MESNFRVLLIYVFWGQNISCKNTCAREKNSSGRGNQKQMLAHKGGRGQEAQLTSLILDLHRYMKWAECNKYVCNISDLEINQAWLRGFGTCRSDLHSCEYLTDFVSEQKR